MNGKHTGIVKYRLNPERPARLSPKQKAALQKMPDAAIDYTDIPSQKGMTWTRPGALVPSENKQQITLRLDADVLKFFKKTGKRYQSRINAALREYVTAQKKAV
ncbi:MAG: BrnA antitoxin family protein [Silvibacterium sp.]